MEIEITLIIISMLLVLAVLDFPDFSNFCETIKTAKEIAMRNLLAFFTNFSLLQRGICNSYINMHYIRHKYALGMVDDVPSEQHYREKKGKFKVLQSMQCQYAFTSAGYVNYKLIIENIEIFLGDRPEEYLYDDVNI